MPPASPVSTSNPARHSEPALTLSGLTLVRGGMRILDGISWRVEHGEHWAVLGANGSGKTSLLSALTGYATPTSGKIDLLGKRYGAANWPELRKSVGIVSSSVRQQMADGEPAILSVVSGKYAMIDFWGEADPQDLAEAREILSQIGCAHLEERPWRVLSQGERQRVLIGRALMARPRLLILDEPCAGLDPVAREYFLQFVENLTASASALTLVLVTHHVEEIVEGISHALVLKEGRVLAAGKREETLAADVLSEAFGERVTLANHGGRAALIVERGGRKLFAAAPDETV